MIRVAIVEDNAKERTVMTEYIQRYEKECGEQIALHSYSTAGELLYAEKKLYDVIFLDIEMPGISGMEAAEMIRNTDKNVSIIFVTNMAKYAISGYKVGALDYFLKPVRYYDLKLRLDEIRFRLERQRPTITLQLAGTVRRIPKDQLYYVEITSHELSYHTVDGVYTVSRRKALRDIESEWKELGFVRCSSSYLVNLEWCTALRDDNVIVAGTALKISRGMKKDFVTRLSEVMLNR